MLPPGANLPLSDVALQRGAWNTQNALAPLVHRLGGAKVYDAVEVAELASNCVGRNIQGGGDLGRSEVFGKGPMSLRHREEYRQAVIGSEYGRKKRRPAEYERAGRENPGWNYSDG